MKSDFEKKDVNDVKQVILRTIKKQKLLSIGIVVTVTGAILTALLPPLVLAKIHIPDMKNIRGKAGLFGGKFAFNYDGKEYKFKLPAKAEKFVDFFRKVKARG